MAGFVVFIETNKHNNIQITQWRLGVVHIGCMAVCIALVSSPLRESDKTEYILYLLEVACVVMSLLMCRMLDLMVHPSCPNTPEPLRQFQTPPRTSSMWTAPKSVPRAPELDLLQTPQVVKVTYLIWLSLC